MAVRRDAEGNIIQEESGLRERSGAAAGGEHEDRRTVVIGGAGGSPPERVRGSSIDGAPARGRPPDGARYSAATVKYGAAVGQAEAGTRVVRPGASFGAAARKDPHADAMNDPPVGWLVIVDGPGKGSVATLGIGRNPIGREPGQRICLNHGDTTISREKHAVIIYDPVNRRFHIAPGEGFNLTYVEDEPVMAPRELEPLTHVKMGNTILRFVPFCGDAFSWDDESENDT